MKKLWLAALMVCMLVTCALGFAACDEQGGESGDQSGVTVPADPNASGDGSGKPGTAPDETETRPAPSVTAGGITYTLSGDKTHYIVSAADSSLSSAAISKTVHNLPVSAIGDYAFYGCSNLSAITISDSVTSVGDSAFA